MEGEGRGRVPGVVRGRKLIALDPNARWLLMALASITLVIVAANVAFYVARFGFGHESLDVPLMLDLDHEENLPTYFSALVLTLSAWMAVRVGLAHRRTPGNESALWFVLAGALFFVSVDEIVELHERLTDPLREAFGLSGILYFAWVVPAIVVLLVMTPIGLRFLRHTTGRMRSLYVLAALLYVGGSIGMELVGGYFFEAGGYSDPMYIAAATIEESAELAGLLVLWYALALQLDFDAAMSTLPGGNPCSDCALPLPHHSA